MKNLINKFAYWLWIKTYSITATEIMMMEEAKRPRKCEHCGLSPIHFIDKTCCKNSNPSR
jgi:hypothetical protein